MSTFRDSFWQDIYKVALKASFEHPEWFAEKNEYANSPSAFAHNMAETAVYNLDTSVRSGRLKIPENNKPLKPTENVPKPMSTAHHGQEVK
jgi:hypothetical protein